jgi:uncharacterized membrane protein YeiH
MSVLLIRDLAGTFVFAFSGASAGVTRRLDLFGVLLLYLLPEASGASHATS